MPTKAIRCKRCAAKFEVSAFAPNAKYCKECKPIIAREKGRIYYWKKKEEGKVSPDIIKTIPKSLVVAVKGRKKIYQFNDCLVVESNEKRCKEYLTCKKARSCFELAQGIDLLGWVRV